jgi:hypothetical protein
LVPSSYTSGPFVKTTDFYKSDIILNNDQPSPSPAPTPSPSPEPTPTPPSPEPTPTPPAPEPTPTPPSPTPEPNPTPPVPAPETAIDKKRHIKIKIKPIKLKSLAKGNNINTGGNSSIKRYIFFIFIFIIFIFYMYKRFFRR